MSSDDERSQYLSIHTEIPANQRSDNDQVEPSQTESSDSSANLKEQAGLNRTSTGRSVRQRTFEPISHSDPRELRRLASTFTDEPTEPLEKRKSPYGVNLSDPALDPKSPEFDVYKWSQM
jgi:ATP-binding cassette subfamily G (WHITE) protein 2 (PDR)